MGFLFTRDLSRRKLEESLAERKKEEGWDGTFANSSHNAIGGPNVYQKIFRSLEFHTHMQKKNLNKILEKYLFFYWVQKSFRMRVQNKCDNYSDRMQEKSRNKYLMYQNGSHLKRVMIQL